MQVEKNSRKDKQKNKCIKNIIGFKKLRIKVKKRKEEKKAEEERKKK